MTIIHLVNECLYQDIFYQSLYFGVSWMMVVCIVCFDCGSHHFILVSHLQPIKVIILFTHWVGYVFQALLFRYHVSLLSKQFQKTHNAKRSRDFVRTNLMSLIVSDDYARTPFCLCLLYLE
jgi:hypothetical protein